MFDGQFRYYLEALVAVYLFYHASHVQHVAQQPLRRVLQSIQEQVVNLVDEIYFRLVQEHYCDYSEQLSSHFKVLGHGENSVLDVAHNMFHHLVVYVELRIVCPLQRSKHHPEELQRVS